MLQSISKESPGIQILDEETFEKLMSNKGKIGTGATATVYKVKNIFTNKGFLCLKILNSAIFKKEEQPHETKKVKDKKSFWNDDEDDNDDDIKDDEDEELSVDFELIRQLCMECEILNNFNHPNIVKVYGFYNGDKNHCPAILLEYCKSNLEKVINLLDNADIVAIIYEICLAMKYVHSKKIIHRDLKMRNILIDSNKHVKICDFGIAKAIDMTILTSMTHNVGTFAFMAPEVFACGEKYTEKVDEYAFGVILYFCVTNGKYPKYSGPGNYDKLDLPRSINKVSANIIKTCWSYSPEKRPSFAQILKYIVDNKFMLFDGIENEIPKIKQQLGLK